MATLPRRIARRVARPVQQVTSPQLEEVDERLRLLDEKFDRINHLVVTIDGDVQANRHEILAARHDAHVLMVTDIDAANEATALLSRSLADHRDLVEDRLDRLERKLDDLTAALTELTSSIADPPRDDPTS